MVKLITSAKHKWGQKNVIPHLKGETMIGTDGTIEVADEDIAQKVITSVPDFSLFEPEEILEAKTQKALKPKVEENTLGKEAGGQLTSETDDNDKPATDEEADNMLKNKTLAQLQTMAKDAGLPDEKWSSLAKPDLKAYLKGILTGTNAQ